MPDRITAHYERHAQAFDAARSRAGVERGWLGRLMLVVPRADGRVLDLGCGGGEPVARYLIDRGAQLTGVDASAALLALARTRFPRQRWIHGDMRTVAVDGTFHAVLAWDSFFHLSAEDQPAMIARMAAWLEPGGLLLFNTGPAAGEAIGEQFGEPLFHASLAPGEYRALFAAHGLREIAFAPEDAATGGRSVWLARRG